MHSSTNEKNLKIDKSKNKNILAMSNKDLREKLHRINNYRHRKQVQKENYYGEDKNTKRVKISNEMRTAAKRNASDVQMTHNLRCSPIVDNNTARDSNSKSFQPKSIKVVRKIFELFLRNII